MFGKLAWFSLDDLEALIKFQSPCAGNMFGKVWRERAGLGGATNFQQFQSPCAGNMFGKQTTTSHPMVQVVDDSKVSIPVCGEHVW